MDTPLWSYWLSYGTHFVLEHMDVKVIGDLWFTAWQGVFAEIFLKQNAGYKIQDVELLQGIANALLTLNGFQHNVQSKRTKMRRDRFTSLIRNFDSKVWHCAMLRLCPELKSLFVFLSRICCRMKTSKDFTNEFVKLILVRRYATTLSETSDDNDLTYTIIWVCCGSKRHIPKWLRRSWITRPRQWRVCIFECLAKLG